MSHRIQSILALLTICFPMLSEGALARQNLAAVETYVAAEMARQQIPSGGLRGIAQFRAVAGPFEGTD